LIFLGNRLGRHLHDVMPMLNKAALLIPVLVIVVAIVIFMRRRESAA
jgi:hypothetical protein